ncbi:hypothetical protein [Streptomyces abyssomicinicus]|uniref:hypothetical protein n=1 Tax=Streptomyces abyssomicinicus TaxID=574929 RepID=UPI0012507516|nr:hypothetical protein [Streptomyces abyssomicinicus]
MSAGYEDDPLAAVLNGDPAPPDADPAARAAHEAALADVRLIREALRGIGDTLAAAPAPPALAAPAPAAPASATPTPPPAPSPVPAAPRRRPRRRFALVWAAGLTTAAAAFTGVMYAGATGGFGAGSTADAAKSAPDAGGGTDEKAAVPDPAADGGAACASLVVEGTVVSVRPVAGGHVQVVLEAERYWMPRQKAADAPTAVTVLPEDAREDLRPGTRAVVTKGPDGDRWVTGAGLATEREELDAVRPGADGRACPPG